MRWRIKCEPHVAIRIKRVFGKIAKHSHGEMELTDSDENARDLAWFIERYPMDLGSDADLLFNRSRAHVQRQSEIERMLEATYSPRTFDLAVQPRAYQRLAAEMLLRSGSLLLADDVGLGKTCSAICTLTDPRTRPALVVTLTHLPRQWEAEIKKFAPTLRTHIVKSSTPYDLSIGAPSIPGQFALVSNELPDIIIINYHKLSSWAEALAPMVRSVIFDEAQEVRRDGSFKYSAARHIAEHAKFRMGLTATPVYNYGSEIWNVLDVISPGALGDRAEFGREWCIGDDGRGGESIADPKAFGTYAREQGLMLRRTRAEVGRELPDLSRVPHHIDTDEKALEEISASAAELARTILRQGENKKGDKWHASEELSNVLRQATGIAKAPYVAEFVRLLVESGEKVVLYGWHRAVYDIWLDKLAPFKPALYTGSETANQKDESRRRFVEGETPILIMSLRAGAGLDGLQFVSRTVVFGELDWSPGVHHQCVGRVHRDGQQDPVVAYFLLAESGADPVIADVLGLKKAQSDGLLDPNAELVESLDIGTGNVKRLAEAYLKQRGLPAPAPVVEAASAAGGEAA